MLRKLLKIVGWILGAIVLLACLLVGGVWVWLEYYTADLPDVTALSRFAPTSSTTVVDENHKTDEGLKISIVAVPYSEIGSNLINAIKAAESVKGHSGVLRTTLMGFVDFEHYSQRPHGIVTLEYQIARTLFLRPERTINRQMHEFRTTIQIERKFSEEQILTIYANRVYFGNEAFGVNAAAQHCFQKNPKDLSLAEAAWLAGLIKSPNMYLKHSDRALERRNKILDWMVDDGMISRAEADSAKQQPISAKLD